jgi:purine-binding chemotaxis protein CheW
VNYYLNCRIGYEWYGIDIQYVLEVLPMLALSELPNSQFLGIVNLRENLLPVLDLRTVFEHKIITYTPNTPLIALQHQQKYLGLIVDETDRVLAIATEQIASFQHPFIQGALVQAEPILLLLDVVNILQKYSVL